MAKQRRVGARPTTKKPAPSRAHQTIGVLPEESGSSTPEPPPTESRRSTFPEAVQLYERGLRALQTRQYGEAAGLLNAVIDRFPEEKELHERARLYLNVCLRHLQPPDATPRSLDERVYAATLAINAGRYADGIEQLRLVVQEDPSHDYALYMLGVALALAGHTEQASLRLRQAFELNADNVALARRDPDLESLRQVESFRQLMEQFATARREVRPTGRSRTRS